MRAVLGNCGTSLAPGHWAAVLGSATEVENTSSSSLYAPEQSTVLGIEQDHSKYLKMQIGLTLDIC